MAEVSAFKRQDYPADTRTMGSDDARPPSGYFSLHFTYPDTEYTDATTFTWAGGGNALGMHFLVRTNLANDSVGTYSNGENFYVIDLKRASDAASAASSSLTYDLGSKEAAMMIASAINSSRAYQTGSHSRGRYLRAKYQSMSGRANYEGVNWNPLGFLTGGEGGSLQWEANGDQAKGSANYITLKESSGNDLVLSTIHPGDKLYTAGANSRFVGTALEVRGTKVYLKEDLATDLSNSDPIRLGKVLMSFDELYIGEALNNAPTVRLPTDIPQKGKLTATFPSTEYILYYDSWEVVADSNFGSLNQTGQIAFNVYDYNTPYDFDGVVLGSEPTWTIHNETEQQHTVVVSWESDTPTGGGYWGTANGGPIVQGLGAPLPVWYLTAKPMDGGNMGLPDITHESRGAQPSALSGHGYSRFSIEGLNSCVLPDLPPPDMPFDGPVIMGEVASDPFQWTGLNDQRTALADDELLLDDVEFGTELDEFVLKETECYVSTNATLSAGVSQFNAMTPNTAFGDHFEIGDTIYTKDGQSVGVVDGVRGIHSMGLRALGPARRTTGLELLGATQNTGVLFVSVSVRTLTVTGTDATTKFAAGQEVWSPSGEFVGLIDNVPNATTIKLQEAPLVSLAINDELHRKSLGLTTTHNHLVFSALSGEFAVGDVVVTSTNVEIGTVADVYGSSIELVDNQTIALFAGTVIYIRKVNYEVIELNSAGTGYVDAIGVNTIGGSGTGMTVDIVTFSGAIIKVRMNAPGSGYVAGDIIVIDQPPAGGGDIRYNGKPTGIEYTSSDFDLGIPLEVYDANADGVTTASPEALGAVSGTIGDYTYAPNPNVLMNSVSEIFGRLFRGAYVTSTLGSYTFSRMYWLNLDKDIATDTLLYRACPTITLSSPTTIDLVDSQPLYKIKKTGDWSVALENGYEIASKYGSMTNATESDYATLNNMRQSTTDRAKAVVKNGLKSENTTISTSTSPFVGSLGYVSRPYRVTRTVSAERVRGLYVPNEERVWDSISVVDDKGQELILEGGSPFGTVIKDFTYKQTRLNPNTGTETPLPSTVGSGIEPNLEINLPSQDEIPGNIIVRSGHDRVQAWNNLTWGMGGLSAPTSGLAGDAESSLKDVQVTAFDTHDRVLHFHPVRIIHDKMESQFGLTLNTTAGGVPSGTTRLFAAHRLSDHVERGSVLLDTNNGADGSYLHPHHRIRFGRQGHSFVAPLTTRGTPMALRRQLHRSHGSAYSLLFEAETEHKHWGFQSAYNGGIDPPSATVYYLDTLEVKSEAYNTGSFASDGFPMSEIKNAGLPNWRRYDGATPHDQIDLLFAPGQLHTKVEGATEQAQWVSGYYSQNSAVFGPYGSAATSGPIALTVGSRTVNNRHNAGEEFAMNGFMLSQYMLMGGRPNPTWIQNGFEASDGLHTYYSLTGHPAGWRTARVGTELATVPPLIAHDPEMVNMSAVPVANVESPSSSGDFDAEDSHADLALVSSSDTNSNAIPDAFLCTWLAEYSHPALLGTSREQYMTFRYREAGMPNAVDQPSVRGLYLRNAPATDTDSVDKGMAFERIYAFQWLQQYGYNGLNAGGHGTNWGQRSASAVLMGHTGLREPHGTLELRQHFVLRGASTRYSRGEGIGDGLNPRKAITKWVLDKDTTNSYEWNEMTVVQNPMVAVDLSRRLPVRAFGFKGASDALNMLAGDPAETSSSMDAILRSARFDGGKHDSMNDLPTGGDWAWGDGTYTGIERTVPIGMVISQHTNEGIGREGFNRLSNTPWTEAETRVGMGRVLQDETLGMVSHRAMPSGVVDAHRTEFATITGSSAKFLQAKSMNMGLDPIIGLNHHSGDRTKAANSVEAVYQASEFGASVGSEFYHHKGNNLHLNAHPVDVKINGDTDNQHFPAVGWGTNLNMKDKGEAERGTLPIPLHEIADHRQVQSDVAPRLGLSVETHSEYMTGENSDYVVTSTKAVSLHSDLAVGQVFPITPSWVQDTRWTKYGGSEGSITTDASRPDETYGGQSNPNQKVAKPKWSLNENMDLASVSNPFSDDILQANGVGVRDHWAVRGSADLPAWGGVFILRKTWLERPENTDALRSKQGGKNAAIKSQVAQPVRKYADYIVRMVRPLKVFGYTTKNDSDGNDMNQDGWLLGPYSTVTQAGSKDQPYTRDKRYGMFETTTTSQIGDIQGISSPYDSAPTIEWPDANNRDVVWHLIPSANMLQHFKADASRKDAEGRIVPLVEARYSQSTHAGGGEYISQTETVYATDDTVVVNPYLKRDKDANAVVKQPSTAMLALGAKAVIKFDAKSASPSKIVVDDATSFAQSGVLVIIGLTGQITYTSRTHNTFDGLTLTFQCASADLTGYTVRAGKNTGSAVSKIENIAPTSLGLVVLPSLVDNAVSVGKLLSDKWDATTSDDSAIINTNMGYRGIGHYNPSDFFMLSAQTFVLNDGQNTGLISYKRNAGTGGMSKVYVDGTEMIPSRFPPYLIDAMNQKWRIAKAQNNEGDGDFYDTFLTFKNLTENSLSASGMEINSVRLGHFMGVGLRSTDAALLLMKDIIKSIPGIDLEKFRVFLEQKATDAGVYADYSSAHHSTEVARQAFLFAHPNLRDAMLHSHHFISRKTRGIGIMDALRDLSRIDGYQLSLSEEGLLIYSPNIFIDMGRRVGTSSGPRNISVSQMLEMANQVIVEGDEIAINETVRASVKDLERMKRMGGVGDDEGVERTLKTRVLGVKERSVALRLAKGLLRRTEQGSALIRVEGLIKCSDIKPGEIIRVDFTAEAIKGEFVVFEVFNDYNTGLTDIVMGQYEKGIEGLLADLQTSTSTTSDDNATRTDEQIDITLNAPIQVISAHRVMTRFVNGTRLLIGGRWRGEPTTNQLGVIGVRGGDTGVLINNGGGYATSTTTMTVDGVNATERFAQHDAVLNANHEVIGYINSVTATTITLKAGSLVAVSDNERLRVSSSRQLPIGHSKSRFYEVK